jgi:anti-anti-sigma factor
VSTPSEFAVSAEPTSPGVVTVTVVGELDMSTCPQVDDVLRAATSDRVIVDLSRCTFLDSAGVRLLVGSHRAVTSDGRRLELVASDPNILRVLEITNVDTVMAVHPSLDAAL